MSTLHSTFSYLILIGLFIHHKKYTYIAPNPYIWILVTSLRKRRATLSHLSCFIFCGSQMLKQYLNTGIGYDHFAQDPFWFITQQSAEHLMLKMSLNKHTSKLLWLVCGKALSCQNLPNGSQQCHLIHQSPYGNF